MAETERRAPVLTDEQFAILVAEDKLRTAHQVEFQRNAMQAMLEAFAKIPEPSGPDQGVQHTRDMFAMAALEGLLAGRQNGWHASDVSRNAFEIADAMMKRRGQ